MRARLFFFAVTATVLAACSEPPVTPVPSLSGVQRLASVSGDKTYLVLLSSNNISSGFSVSIGSVGGKVVNAMDKIGVAVVTSSNPDFASKASKIKGVQGVVEDYHMKYDRPKFAAQPDVASPPATANAGVGSAEPFRGYQWAVDAVRAPGAWAVGALGAGARVAIIDGGIYSAHPDLAANIDDKRSRSFVPGYPYNYDQDEDGLGGCLDDASSGFWHGTHVAGIVAAAENGDGTIGIAPSATIVGLKAMHCGGGDFGAIIQAIYYAATPIAEGGAGANVINMSLGALIPKNLTGISHFLNALGRATSYANQRDVTVIASAGNSHLDLDHSANWVSVPAQSVGVLAVAATGPVGFFEGATNFDRPASYTNYGQSAISLAGPGGDFVSPNDATWFFDMVLAPCRSGWCFAAGTSMASPAVAGVAALIVGSHPGIGHAQVEAILRGTADDLGKPGQDDFYGAGRVNATRAVQ